MSKKCFQFKQFSIAHDRCAMKVGTDGVLLGAWTPLNNAQLILEVGTGSGLIALMLAQRSTAQIVAVEIDADAASQAQENVAATNWKNRIEINHCDFLSFSSTLKFDLVVSNPPFFDDSLISPSESRNLARHTRSLSYLNLIEKSVSLLSEKGRICFIIPNDRGEKVEQIAIENGLFLTKKIEVLPKPDALPKRLLLEFSRTPDELLADQLVIEIARHQYSNEYIALTKEFYLKM